MAKEYEEVLCMKDENFDNNQMNRLMRHILKFCIQLFGDKPSNVEQNAVAIAVNAFFPKIKQEIIRNTNDGGKLGIGLRNKRFALNKNKVGATVENNLSDTEPSIEFELLKSTLVNTANMQTIKDRLKLTLQYRVGLLRRVEINLLEYFPYFFVSAELVSSNKLNN